MEDTATWTAVSVIRGNVVEVHLGSSDWEPKRDIWAAFLALETELEGDRSLKVRVRYLGCEDGDVHGQLKDKFKDLGELHLCVSRPCLYLGEDQGFTLHVTRVRLWQWPDFRTAPYLPEGIEEEVRKALGDKEEEKPPKEVKPPRRPKEPPTKPKVSRSKPKATPKRTGTTRKKGDGPQKGKEDAPVEDEKDGDGPPLTSELRKRLRKRLEAAKGRLRKPEEEIVPVDSEEEEDSKTSGEDDNSDCARDGLHLKSGSTLTPALPSTALVKVGKKEKKKRTDELEAVLNTTSMTSWRGQLVKQAVRAAKDTEGQRKKRKSSGSREKSAASKLTEALAALLGAGKDPEDKKEKKGKKKKKKKKKKRRVRKDGVIESCSSSYSSDSEEEEAVLSSEEELETPIRKRSRDSPGSILAMLTTHVRDQLEQSSAIDLNAADNSVTAGVKILTYFTLQLKPAFGGHQKELRELHHLAVTMDTLRKGDIARTGDSLAARFMAIHQSLLDQNWSAAKHLELYPMEEATAATSSVILATRKHSRLVAKMQGYPNYNYWGGFGRGRGKGGKAEWNYYNDGKGEQKGKKGKKGDLKGKGRGGGNPQPGGKEDGSNKWKDNKEKE